jgi:HD-GYP domain-containing protein (c-di-GMP phosphodiesterase class II)
MKYVQIPVAMLEVGKPLPVDVFSAQGQLLLRKGQPIVSEQHRDKLHSFAASASVADAQAWQRAYERMVQAMMRNGVDVREIAQVSMPSEIRPSDYVVGQTLSGGWLDLQVVLRGILYQGGLSINPLPRLVGIHSKAKELLQADPDDSLFSLFQALADNDLGYCPTHGLLCATICDLTATKLNMPMLQREALMAAALTMNIGMAREQDAMTRQIGPLNHWQRDLVGQHASTGAQALRSIGVDDSDQLDLVRWHHQWDSTEALPHNREARHLLHLADIFVARTAARRSRPGLAPVQAVKSMVLGAQGDAVGVGSAMAQSVGFYPPGSYVKLLNGEIAVAAQRGERANTPWVISVVGKDGMPISNYVCKNTAESANAISGPVLFEAVKVMVNGDKVRRARERIAGSL